MFTRPGFRIACAATALALLSGCSWVRTHESPYLTADEEAVVSNEAAATDDLELLRREFVALESRIAALEETEIETARKMGASERVGAPQSLARLGPPPAREAMPASAQPNAAPDEPRPAIRPSETTYLAEGRPPNPVIRSRTEQTPTSRPSPEPVAVPATESVLRAAHLASYSSRETARRGWVTLSTQFPGSLGPLTPRVERADLGTKGVFYRLKAGPFGDDAAVKAACRPLVSSGVYCAPTHYRGDAL
ncbi:MAG: hypothetical protein AAFR11_13645 [Pseudomonadota bacterium]